MPATKKEEVKVVEVKNNDLIIKFAKPYQFEGETYNEVDLSGLEDVTASQLSSVESEVHAIMPELAMEYSLILASKVTNHPQAFFLAMPGKEGLKVKRLVTGFLNS